MDDEKVTYKGYELAVKYGIKNICVHKGLFPEATAKRWPHLLAYAWYFRGLGPHGITERSKLARTGHRVLENKYYFDWLYTDVIVRAVKGPIAKAAYWFNQRGIDGVINTADNLQFRSRFNKALTWKV